MKKEIPNLLTWVILATVVLTIGGLAWSAFGSGGNAAVTKKRPAPPPPPMGAPPMD